MTDALEFRSQGAIFDSLFLNYIYFEYSNEIVDLLWYDLVLDVDLAMNQR